MIWRRTKNTCLWLNLNHAWHAIIIILGTFYLNQQSFGISVEPCSVVMCRSCSRISVFLLFYTSCLWRTQRLNVKTVVLLMSCTEERKKKRIYGCVGSSVTLSYGLLVMFTDIKQLYRKSRSTLSIMRTHCGCESNDVHHGAYKNKTHTYVGQEMTREMGNKFMDTLQVTGTKYCLTRKWIFLLSSW